MLTGTKHLIKCRCVMTQFRSLKDPPQHQFVVFSAIKDNVVIPKFAQCNNCGVIHKVTDICKSEITSRENLSSIVTIDDMRSSISKNLANILDNNDSDHATWEMAKFVVDNKHWGQIVVLTSEVESGTRSGKYLQILGENLFKVEQFSREEYAR